MKINFKKSSLILGVGLLAFTAVADESNSSNNQNAPVNPAGNSISSQQFVWDAGTTDIKEVHLGELALQKSDNSDVQSFAKHMIADHKKACKKLQAIADKEGLNFPDTNTVIAAMMNTNMVNMPADTNGYATTDLQRGDHVFTNQMNTAMDNANTMSGDTNIYQSADAQRTGHAAFTNLDASISDTNLAANSNWNTNGYQAADAERGGHILTNTDNLVDQMGLHHEINLVMLSGSEFDRAYANKMVKGHEQAIQEFETASADLTDADLKKYADKTLPTLRMHLRMAQELQAKLGLPSSDDITNTAAMNQ